MISRFLERALESFVPKSPYSERTRHHSFLSNINKTSKMRFLSVRDYLAKNGDSDVGDNVMLATL